MSNITKASWKEYYGNNHKKIPRPDVIAGGDVHFKKHLGLPLSQSLWEDLIHRLMVSGLCVYRYHDPQWTIGWTEGHCCIQLDEEDKVSDISFSPYKFFLYHKGQEQ
jgi:hypothetical protein